MRLIDADSIKPADVIGGASEFAIDIRKAMRDLIDSQPTAFDLDEVLKQLREEEQSSYRFMLEDEEIAHAYASETRHEAWKEALEIVQSGVMADKAQEAAGTEEIAE